MGRLINGKWVDSNIIQTTDGNFIREDSSFRHNISKGSRFNAQANRYHLYVSYACPWAHRVMIFRHLKELENIISMDIVKPLIINNGWEFDKCNDTINNKQYLYEIYTLANKEYNGKVTVPVLWDTVEKTIVNNESSEIIRILNSSFNDITGNTLDFYPSNLRSEIDKINHFIYHNINNGVYKVGFSTNQKAYDIEVHKLFNALNVIEDLLSKQRYLVGNNLTEADWRLFTTLIRFDSVYVGHFKCNQYCLHEYDHLSNYVRELYQIPGIKETVNMQDIKLHYYKSHTSINPTGIVPTGPNINYELPHNRNILFK